MNERATRRKSDDGCILNAGYFPPPESGAFLDTVGSMVLEPQTRGVCKKRVLLMSVST
jgi:hypothetical protein